MPVLQLNEASVEVLRGAQTVRLRKPEGWSLSKTAAEEEAWEGVDSELFENLRRLRKELASVENVPAFQVFGDKTLRELARQRPGTREALLAIYGMGRVRVRKFGDRILEAISNFNERGK
jgi:ATP-dependent DNA helicase RecQ